MRSFRFGEPVFSYQLSVISYQLTEKTPHFPTSHTLHPTPHFSLHNS
ncbi:hypothetical protein O53_740 [Microcystis aeruginosa TAIHU98]|uniref:Uncharacterized protein n=1 Tax=Microcystis aeruginosa TAIHU98 TaxID=1134457 RepID=L7E9M4_MICAE|nr:hypothetical protein O53_740 [Microcystis aeruginosa TAIHU98]